MSSDSLRDRLASLEALLAAETDDPNVALEKLYGLVDPESLRRRITMLLKLNRLDEAHAIVVSRPPHPDWIEAGIRGAILAGDIDLAIRLVHSSIALQDSTGTLHLRGAVAFGDTVLGQHFQTRERKEDAASIYAVEPDVRPTLERSIVFLSSHCDAVLQGHAITSPLTREAVTLLTLSLGLLGKGKDAETYILLLAQSRHLHTAIGQFAVQGRLPRVAGLADALTATNPDDFFSRLFGITLRYEVDRDWRIAFGELTSLKWSADNSSKRGILFSALSEVATRGDALLLTELGVLRSALLDKNDPYHKTRLANHEMGLGNWAAAEELLNESALPADPLWSWTLAQCHLSQGRLDDGIPRLVNAAIHYRDDEWLQEAASRAYQHGHLNDSIRCLEHLRDYYPWHLSERKNLAIGLWQLGRLDDATVELEHLVGILPDDLSLCLQLAHCYLKTNHPDRVVALLTDLCNASTPPLHAPILLATALRQLDRVKDGFAVLKRHKENFRSEKDFLFAYVEIGYAAGEEHEATLALKALDHLRETGKLDPKLFRLVSLDDLIDLGHRYRERQQKINSLLLRGQIPWTLAAESSRRPLLWDWKLRTQELTWVSEDPSSRAEYSVYATNGFAVHPENDEGSRVIELESAPPDSDVCVDYSALITLFALNKLPLLFTTYRNVIVPSEYRSKVLTEAQQLQPHQISHRDGYEAIRRLVDRQVIAVATEDERSQLTRINEYAEDSGEYSVRRLAAAVDCLAHSGRINSSQEAAIRMVAHRIDASASPLQLNERVVIDLHTLMTIFREGLLETFAQSFRLHLPARDEKEIVQDLHGFEFQQEALVALRQLWDDLNKYRNVRFAPSPVENDDDDGNALLSHKIAESQRLPLLCDDRSGYGPDT